MIVIPKNLFFQIRRTIDNSTKIFTSVQAHNVLILDTHCELRSVQNHHGHHVAAAHYTSHFRQDDNQWIECNDANDVVGANPLPITIFMV